VQRIAQLHFLLLGCWFGASKNGTKFSSAVTSSVGCYLIRILKKCFFSAFMRNYNAGVAVSKYYKNKKSILHLRNAIGYFDVQ
jgi:hypothetical protein